MKRRTFLKALGFGAAAPVAAEALEKINKFGVSAKDASSRLEKAFKPTAEVREDRAVPDEADYIEGEIINWQAEQQADFNQTLDGSIHQSSFTKRTLEFSMYGNSMAYQIGDIYQVVLEDANHLGLKGHIPGMPKNYFRIKITDIQHYAEAGHPIRTDVAGIILDWEVKG